MITTTTLSLLFHYSLSLFRYRVQYVSTRMYNLLHAVVVKVTSLVIIVACWQETILLMMSTTPASLYALVINALLFIGFYTKMRCPQIALTFSGDSSFEVQLLFIKTSQGCSECDLVCQFVIDLFYTLRDYTIYYIHCKCFVCSFYRCMSANQIHKQH